MKNAVRIFVTDDFVMLDQVDVVSFKPPQRFVKLPRCFLPRPPIDFGHQENPLSITIAQRLTHPDLAGSVKSPSSEKGDSSAVRIIRGVDMRLRKMPAANANGRYLDSCATQIAINHVIQSNTRLAVKPT